MGNQTKGGRCRRQSAGSPFAILQQMRGENDVPGRHYAIEHGFKHVHRRTAFQAEPSQWSPPRTASPVIVASLRTAFQADDTIIKLFPMKPFSFSSLWLFRFLFSLKILRDRRLVRHRRASSAWQAWSSVRAGWDGSPRGHCGRCLWCPYSPPCSCRRRR